MYDGLKSLKEILSTNKDLKPVQRAIKQAEVIENFFEIFPNLSKMVEPLKVEKATLHLFIENASLRNEIKFHETELIDRINEFFKEKRIRYIKLIA